MATSVRLSLLLALLLHCPGAIAQGVKPFCDVLVWHASEETSSIWSSVISSSSFSAEDVDFGWKPGFRLGFVHEPEEPAWDAKVAWTCFRTSEQITIPTGTSLVVPEFFSAFASGDGFSFTGATLDWSLAYNTVLVETGRKIALGDCVWLRPSFGLTGALIDQKVRLDLANSSGLTGTERVTHKFSGLGPSFGLSGGWDISRCGQLSLVGSLSADLLFGTWNVDDTYRRTGGTSTGTAYGSLTTSLNDSNLGTPVLKYFLGLEWTRPGEVTITGRLGYELQWWANQQRMPTFQQLPMHGDLTLQGLTCGLSFSF